MSMNSIYPSLSVKVFVSWQINPLILSASEISLKAISEYSLCEIKVFSFGNNFSKLTSLGQDTFFSAFILLAYTFSEIFL